MSTITMKTSVFGTLDIDQDADLWEKCLIELDGKDLDVCLSIDGGLVTEESGDQVLKLLESVPLMYRKAKDYLHRIYPEDATVDGFVSFHLTELEPDMLCEALQVPESECTSEALFDALEPCAIVIAPDAKGGVGCMMDFTIGKEYSDEVLCVRFDADMRIFDVAHES